MGISAKFNVGDVSAKVEAFQEQLNNAILLMLQYLGESLVKYAREQHNYTDQTGNLTNSIGYVVVRNGKPVYFGGLNQPGEGSESGMKVAMKMADETLSAFSLIIVAGMNYAAYVEAKGYNVILPAELKAKSDFPAAMKRLTDMAKAKTSEIYGIN